MKDSTSIRKIWTIIFGLLFILIGICSAQGQLLQKDIDSIFLKALLERTDWMQSSSNKYVDLEEQAFIPVFAFDKSPIKILPQNNLIDISRKERKELTVYTLKYQQRSRDTVTVNFSEYNLKALKLKGKTAPLAEISECKCAKFEPDIIFVIIDDKWRIIKSKFRT